MRNKRLIRNGRHMRPLLAVCNRYGIGSADDYGRGVWIYEDDISKIAERMEQDDTAVRGVFDGKPWLAVQGTNRHNYVMAKDFEELFER